jgi:hypothetical protein
MSHSQFPFYGLVKMKFQAFKSNAIYRLAQSATSPTRLIDTSVGVMSAGELLLDGNDHQIEQFFTNTV